MDILFVALMAVAVLLAAALPGYVLMKRRMLSETCIPGFSKILLFVCQPCLAVYSFSELEFSKQTLINLGVFALLIILIHAIMLGGAYAVLRKKAIEPIYRIITIGTTFGNCAFFGIPIIEALMKESAPSLIVYTTVYAFVMNILGWTVGSAIISHNAKYISLKQIFLNPAMFGVVIALIIYIMGIDFPKELDSMIEYTARMATPLSMIVMGMRLATVKLSSVFSDFRIYLTIAVKQILMPLVALAIALIFTGVDAELRRVL